MIPGGLYTVMLTLPEFTPAPVNEAEFCARCILASVMGPPGPDKYTALLVSRFSIDPIEIHHE